MKETVLSVDGMTCNHCVRSVEKALSRLPGVTRVKVQLSPGRAVVTTEQDLDLPTAFQAVEEEGYHAHVP
ncbi:MAG TPA: heavy metal-associated domain-containing protein [bacterium]|nr:heavy metal-associated domain-containing protein [bacterium]